MLEEAVNGHPQSWPAEAGYTVFLGGIVEPDHQQLFYRQTLAFPFRLWRLLHFYGRPGAGFLIVDSRAGRRALRTSSHNSAAEKQYRYPTEYGSQKHPAQWWCRAGAASVGGDGPKVTSATIGRVVGYKRSFNMGGAIPGGCRYNHGPFQDMISPGITT